MDKIYIKWKKWYDIIYREVTNLSINRHVFWEVQKIIKNNPKIQKPSVFYEFIKDGYVNSSLIGIRKQIKTLKPNISFSRLLLKMSTSPDIVTRNMFLVGFEKKDEKDFINLRMRMANSSFNKFSGNESKDIMDKQLLIEDEKSLKAKANNLETWADKRIAHYDENLTELPEITFSEIDICIDFLEELTIKYYPVFNIGSCLSNVLPQFQYDWKKIFYVPWIEVKDSFNLEEG